MPGTLEKKVYLEDYRPGERWVSPGRTIAESDISNYAGLTGDWHALHTDAEYARTTPFGERIAHGFLVLTIGDSLIFRTDDDVTTPETFIAFYGLDNVRFVGPVKIGDTIRCEVEVTSLEIKDEKRGILVFRKTIKNQRDEDVVVYITKVLVGRRPANQASR